MFSVTKGMNKKAWAIALIVFVILALGLFTIFAISHIDIFPGTAYTYDSATHLLTPYSQTISLKDHLESMNYRYESDYDELNVFGYALAFFLIVVLPAAIGFFVGKKFGDA